MVISKNNRKPLIIFCSCIMTVSLIYCLFESDILNDLKVLISSLVAVFLLAYGFNRNNELYTASDIGLEYKGTVIPWEGIAKLRYRYNYCGQHRHECHLHVDDGRVIEFCWNNRVISYLEQYVADVEKFRKGV